MKRLDYKTDIILVLGISYFLLLSITYLYNYKKKDADIKILRLLRLLVSQVRKKITNEQVRFIPPFSTQGNVFTKSGL